jgi:hypothetical protein
MRIELFLISIILFCAISYNIGYNPIEGFGLQARCGTFHTDMFEHSQCEFYDVCRKNKFNNKNREYLLF